MYLTNIEDLPNNLLLDISNYLGIRDRVSINRVNKYLYTGTLASVWNTIDFTKTNTRNIEDIKRFRNLITNVIVKDLNFLEIELSELNMIESLDIRDGIDFLETNFLKLSKLNLVRLETIKLTQDSFNMGFNWFSTNKAFSTLSSISIDGSDSICLELLKTIVTSTRIRLRDLKLNIDTLGDDLINYILINFKELNTLSISTKFNTLLAPTLSTTDNLGGNSQGLIQVNWIELSLNLSYNNDNLIDHIPFLNTLLNRVTLPILTGLNYLEHFNHPNSSTTNPLKLHKLHNLKRLSTNISVENMSLLKLNNLLTLKLSNQELNPLTLSKIFSLKTLKKLVINSGGIKSLIPIEHTVEAFNLEQLELCNHCINIEELNQLLKWTPNLSALSLSQLTIPKDFNISSINSLSLEKLCINHQLFATSEYIGDLIGIFPDIKSLWIDLKFSLYPSALIKFREEFSDVKFCRE